MNEREEKIMMVKKLDRYELIKEENIEDLKSTGLLLKHKKNIKVIASDINQNAYNIALNNVKKEKLENIITLRLGNGLEVVTKDEIDTIIISGLGSMTIVGILKNGIESIIFLVETPVFTILG